MLIMDRLICTECLTEMLPARASNTAYEHLCRGCGRTEWTTKVYPAVQFAKAQKVRYECEGAAS